MATQPLKLAVDQGYVSGRDASDIANGELLEMQNAYYKPGDTRRLWRKPGRTLFGVAEADQRIKGVALCQFDEVDGESFDHLLAYANTTIYSATPGLTGTFSSLITGLSEEAELMNVCHNNDRWYICNGIDPNRVLMPDGTVRLMSMLPNTTPPTVTLNAAPGVPATLARPTANSGNFNNGSNAYDPDPTTASTGTIPEDANAIFYYPTSSPASTHTWSGWASSSVASRKLFITFAKSGGTGAFHHPSVTEIQKSENSGGDWSTLQTITGESGGTQTIQVAISANSSAVQVRVRHWLGNGVGSVTISVYDIYIASESTLSGFDTDVGLYYALTEYNEDEDLESTVPDNANSFSQLVHLTGELYNSVTLTFPTAVNAAATHWRIYRTVDGADKNISSLGRIATVPITDTSFLDTFEVFDKDTEGSPGLPLVQITSEGGELDFPRDVPAPPFRQIVAWKGALCALSKLNPRAWFFSVQGLPESWPDINVNSSFPLAEHDELIAQMPVGETMVFLGKAAVLATDNLPSPGDNQVASSDLRVLRGQPGCVGEQAFCTFSVEGEPRGAWISPFGVHITNGNTARRISDDIEWETETTASYLSTAVLSWDPRKLILWMQHDTDGDGLNDRETPIHIGENHVKPNGMPKWGQPTAKATSCLTGGLVDASYLRYAGHPSDGSVYVEDQGTTDVSAIVDPNMIVTTGQAGPDGRMIAVDKVRVIHSDWGDDEIADLTTTLGIDSSQHEQVRTDTISLDGERPTEQFISRAGDWVQLSLEYNGVVSGAILGFEIMAESPGKSGTITRT